MEESLSYILQDLAEPLLEGFLASCLLIVSSAPLGVLLAVAVACGWVYGGAVVSRACRTYVTVIKGTPLLILLFILYFCMPTFGLMLSPFQASVLGFIMCSGAYMSEYLRGAILSVRSGQLLAARSLGMSQRQGIISIVLPQAARRALPGCANEIIYLIKYSSLAYMLSFNELTGAGKMAASRSYRFTLVFTVVGLLYLLIVTLASYLFGRIEKYFSIPGFESKRS